MKKYIMAAVLLIAGMVTARAAQEFFPCILQVNLNNGQTIDYKFSAEPEATFNGDNLVITVLGEEGVEYPMQDVQSLTFVSDKSGVESVSDDRANLQVEITKEAVTVRGLEAGASLEIYDLSGALRLSVAADNDGTAYAPVADLVKGVYIVRTNAHSFKFIK